MQRCLEAPGKKSKVLRAWVLAAVAGVSGAAAMAQSAPAKSSEEMERAQRDADKVFRMIIINSEAPRKKRAPDGGSAAPAAGAPSKAPATAASLSPAASAALAARQVDSGRAAEASRVDPAESVAAATQLAAVGPTALATRPGSAAAPAVAAEEEEDDSPLVVTSQTPPSFKPALIQELRKGSARVKFEVQTNGSVSKQEIVSSSHRGLNSAALSAIGQWKFQPLKKPRRVEVEVGFNVDD
jgi:TonB family protein